MQGISEKLNNPQDVNSAIELLIDENYKHKKQIEQFHAIEIKSVKKGLLEKASIQDGVTLISAVLELTESNDLKELCSQIRGEIRTFACVLGTVIDNKPFLAIAFSEDLTKEKSMHAGNLIREAAKLIQGGGGGQPFVATAGGKNPDRIAEAVVFAKTDILAKL